MRSALETLLAYVFPPLLGRMRVPVEAEASVDPFARPVLESGIGTLTVKRYRDALHRMECEKAQESHGAPKS